MKSQTTNLSNSMIMIVDDNLDNLRLLSGILSKHGYKTRRAISGKLALQSLAATKFDLVLLDINMPDINGYEVCRTLKEDPSLANIPVIFISALNDVIDKVRAFEVGGIDYITKPFETKEVLARVENQLRIIDLQTKLYNANQKLIQNNQQLQYSNSRYLKNSLVDPITKFKTKISFIGQLRKNLQDYHNNNNDNFFALLIIQCDRLKLYRSILISNLENQCLIYISDCIRQFVPKSSILGRLNETEFAVFIENINIENIDNIIQTISQLQQKLKLPFTLNEQEFFLNPSCGIVIGDRNYQSPEQILCDARQALFSAISEGQGNYQIFEPKITKQTSTDSQLKLDFIKALNEKELLIEEQPIISFATGKISGQKAYISGSSLSDRFVSAEELGCLAEETGFIDRLNNYLLEWAGDRINKYHTKLTFDNIDSDFKIRIKLSSWQFLQPDLVNLVNQIIQKYQLDGEPIMLEISAKAFIVNEAIAIKNLKNLQHLSIKTSINHFGTNFLSLIDKNNLSIDDLEIDAATTEQIVTNQTCREFYQAVIATAHKLNMSVTANGIDNIEQFNHLSELNCDFGQGNWISEMAKSNMASSLTPST